MTLTEWFSIGKYRPGVIAEALRHGETGCGIEEQRRGVTTNGVWAGSGEQMAIDSTPMVS